MTSHQPPPQAGNELLFVDWRDRRHWGGRIRRCIYCPGRTPLRDERGRPAHKVCVELRIREAAAPRRMAS